MTKLHKPTIYSPEIPEFVLQEVFKSRLRGSEEVSTLMLLALPDRCAHAECTSTTCDFSIVFKAGQPISRHGAYCSESCAMAEARKYGTLSTSDTMDR